MNRLHTDLLNAVPKFKFTVQQDMILISEQWFSNCGAQLVLRGE
jgi:hypothetical protein